jgi:hypothetical protein
MLTEWLNYEQRNPSPYKFGVIDICEIIEFNQDILLYVAKDVIVAHKNPIMIKKELEILLEDANNASVEVIRSYIENEVLPSKERTQTRIGNFGEILSASILIEYEGFRLPIYKLRFREKKDWAMRLTDLCLIRNDEEMGRPLICYGETKTNTSGVDRQLGIKGHDSLAKDDALDNPEILNFICTWLYETDRFDEAEFLSRIRLGTITCDKRHDLFLVHDLENWREDVLTNLDASQLDERLVDFSVKVVLISNLRQIIDDVYSLACESVEELVL